MLAEKLLDQIMYVKEESNFIRGCFDSSLRLIFIVNFKGFTFSEVYKKFRLKKI